MIVEKTETPLRGNLQRCYFFQKISEKAGQNKFFWEKESDCCGCIETKSRADYDGLS